MASNPPSSFSIISTLFVPSIIGNSVDSSTNIPNLLLTIIRSISPASIPVLTIKLLFCMVKSLIVVPFVLLINTNSMLLNPSVHVVISLSSPSFTAFCIEMLVSIVMPEIRFTRIVPTLPLPLKLSRCKLTSR